MKKSILYLLAILFTTCCITSCGDDENTDNPTNPTEETWKELSKTYENDNLELKMNDFVLDPENKSVSFDAQSATTSKITLNNVLPETTSIEITTTMQEANGIYSFTGEADVNENCKVSINGKIESGKLSIVFKRTLSGELVGDWNLVFNNNSAGIYSNIVTGVEQMDQMINFFIPMLGSALAEEVEAVKVSLPESGVFNVAWRKTGASEDQSLSAVAPMVVMPYLILDGKFILALDKKYMTLLSSVLEGKLAEMGLSMDDLTSLLVDLGGYYGVALNTTEVDGNTAFYADKSLIVPLLNILAPVLSNISDDYQQIEQFLPLLANATSVDLGLTFQKAE